MTDKLFRPFETVPTLMTLLAVGTMFALGIWQLQRLEWKERRMAQVEHAASQAPMTTLPGDAKEQESREYYPVALTGRFDHGNEIHLTPRYWRAQLGYGVVTPFAVADGRTVLVDRGWVPLEKKDPAARPETLLKGKQTVHGIVRLPYRRRFVSLHNQPDKNMWFSVDIPAVEAATGLRLQPVIIEMTGKQEAAYLPVPSDGAIALRNDHLGYALTWFSTGAAGLIVFLLYHRRRNA